MQYFILFKLNCQKNWFEVDEMAAVMSLPFYFNRIILTEGKRCWFFDKIHIFCLPLFLGLNIVNGLLFLLFHRNFNENNSMNLFNVEQLSQQLTLQFEFKLISSCGKD